MLKVIILGSRGFFGKNFIEYYNKINLYNIFYDNLLDIQNSIALDEYVNNIKPDVIINCAGIIGSSSMNIDDTTIFNSNLIINQNIFEICKKYNSHLILFSTYRLFSQEIEDNYNETDYIKSNITNNFGYLYSKKCMNIQIEFYRKYFSITCLYLTNVYGLYDKYCINGRIIPAIIYKLNNFNNIQINCCKNTEINLIHIHDVIKLVDISITNKINDTIIIFYENNTFSIRYIIDFLCNIKNIQKNVNYTIDESIKKIKKPNQTKFKKYFQNFVFTDMKEGIKNTFEYYKNL